MKPSEASESAAGMPRINQRITGLILGFAISSALASVLPLLPEVESWIPLSLFTREGALTLYAGTLLAFTAFCMPLLVLDEGKRAGLGAWWWLGGLIFIFAAVPLYILAYIAGVHRDAVIETLAWAGVVHGVGLLLLRGLGVRRAGVVVALAFVLLVVLPASDAFSGIMSLRDARFSWLPSARVLALCQDYATPRPVIALVILVVVHLLLYASRRGRGEAVTLGAVLVGALALGAFRDASPVEGLTALHASREALTAGPQATSPAGNYWVPGRAYPLRVEVASGAKSLEVRVGERETFVWSPSGGERVLWLYPRLARAGEAIELVVPGAEPTRVVPQRLEEDRVLVLAVGEGARQGLRPAEAAHARVVVCSWGEAEVADFPSDLLDPFSGVAIEHAQWRGLGATARENLDDFVARGGRLIVLGVGGEGDVSVALGEGSRREVGSESLARFGRLQSRRAPIANANLYDQFSLPDWGQVDLGPLITFLVVYHLVFLLIFLVPLRFDGRKRLGVYLVSVGFVLGLVVVGSYFALTRRYLPKTQVLQQDLFSAVLHGGPAGARLAIDELVCFASFNDAPARIEVEGRDGVSAIYRDVGLGVGRVEVDDDRLVFPALPLDRFARKQVVSFRSGAEAPFRLAASELPEVWRLETRPEVADPLGLRDAERTRFGFARRGGRLFGLRREGERLIVAKSPWERAWAEVGPEGSDAAESRAFLKALLARSVDRNRDVFVLVQGGIPLRHEGRGYLSRREILQVLILPLPVE